MYLIITASPNTDGLTAACGKAAYDGITSAGGEAEIVDISAKKLEPCLICGDGWGTCRNDGLCNVKDMFEELQEKFRNAEGVILVSPVYFSQPSERMRYFFERFRRCDVFSENGGRGKDKQVDIIAAAGGGGGGTVNCLAEMELFCRQVGAMPKDKIPVTRFTRELTMPIITDSAARMVKGNYFKGFKPGTTELK